MQNRSFNRGLAARTFVLPLAALSLWMLAGCGGAEKTTDLAEPSAISEADLEVVSIEPGDKVYLTVWGMSCPKCVNNVDQVLAEVSGVKGTSTDMANGVVTVETGWPAPRAGELKAAVEQAGFTLMDVKVAGAQG